MGNYKLDRGRQEDGEAEEEYTEREGGRLEKEKGRG